MPSPTLKTTASIVNSSEDTETQVTKKLTLKVWKHFTKKKSIEKIKLFAAIVARNM